MATNTSDIEMGDLSQPALIGPPLALPPTSASNGSYNFHNKLSPPPPYTMMRSSVPVMTLEPAHNTRSVAQPGYAASDDDYMSCSKLCYSNKCRVSRSDRYLYLVAGGACLAAFTFLMYAYIVRTSKAPVSTLHPSRISLILMDLQN